MGDVSFQGAALGDVGRIYTDNATVETPKGNSSRMGKDVHACP